MKLVKRLKVISFFSLVFLRLFYTFIKIIHVIFLEVVLYNLWEVHLLNFSFKSPIDEEKSKLSHKKSDLKKKPAQI